MPAALAAQVLSGLSEIIGQVGHSEAIQVDAQSPSQFRRELSIESD